MDTDQGITSPAPEDSQDHSADPVQSDADGNFVLDVGTSRYIGKSLQELHANMANGIKEKDRIVGESKQMREREMTHEALSTIVKKLTEPAPQAQPQRDFDDEIAQLEAKLEDAEPSEQRKIERRIARIESERVMQPLLAEVSTTKAELAELRKTTSEYDPERVANRNIIVQLAQENGLDPKNPSHYETLQQMATFRRAKMDQPKRVMPSSGFGGSAGSRSADIDVDTEQQATVMANAVAMGLASVGLDAKATDLKKKYISRSK